MNYIKPESEYEQTKNQDTAAIPQLDSRDILCSLCRIVFNQKEQQHYEFC